jgi:hypothetical protein
MKPPTTLASSDWTAGADVTPPQSASQAAFQVAKHVTTLR